MAKEDKGILLETGTNEFEIVEFTVGSVNYGINVAKVREVINPVAITEMPNAHRFVDGVFTLRGRVMPLVNLARCLGMASKGGSSKIIVSEMNNLFVGFLVDEVSRIHRISWKSMEPAPPVANADMVVGVIKMSDKMVILLDFEKIIADINPEINASFSNVKKVSGELQKVRNRKTILVAEDSKMLRELLVGTLHDSGYTNVIATENGVDAWEHLEGLAADSRPIEQQLQLVITDIEMPQMDGHHLITKIKTDPRLKKLPCVIFSSLINDENRRKGESIGADGQVSKPEIDRLIDIVDKKIL